MKRIAAVFLLVAFVVSFGAGVLMTTNSAEAGCVKSCSIIRCIPEKVCVCGGTPYCCRCVPRP